MPVFMLPVVIAFFAVCTVSAVLLTWLRAQPVTDGSVVVVTGGSRGLGLAIASEFARNPVRLVLASRKLHELEEARTKLLALRPHLRAEDILLITADLAESADCRRLIGETLARFGRIDVLVNNAGIIDVGPAHTMTLDDFHRTLRINYQAALETTWAALPFMLKQLPSARGRRAAVVNIASVGGKMAVPHLLPYTAAKFALVGFSEGLHAELRGLGVRVTTVCPGLMRTGGEVNANFHGDTEAEKRWFNFAAKSPLTTVSVDYAARVIRRATEQGRAEVTISPFAWLAARAAGLAPGLVQWSNAVVNELILPKAK